MYERGAQTLEHMSGVVDHTPCLFGFLLSPKVRCSRSRVDVRYELSALHQVTGTG